MVLVWRKSWDEQISLVVFGVVLTVVYNRLGFIGVALLVFALGYKRQRASILEFALEAAREEGRLEGQLASRGSDERMWFDYALKVFWAKYCTDSKNLSNFFRALIESRLEDVKIPGVRSITVPTFYLGEKRITVLSTTPFRVDERPDELNLDLNLKWYGDATARLAVTFAMRTFYVDISRVSFEGVLRVGCEFVNKKPWAGRLHLSFVGTPRIDFDIAVLGGLTLPMDLRSVVRDALIPVMVFPKKITLPFDRWWGDENFHLSNGDEKSHCGVFSVEIVEADQLKKPHHHHHQQQELDRTQKGSNNCFVKLSVGSTARKSFVDKTDSPAWNQKFNFLVKKSTDHVKFLVVDQSQMHHVIDHKAFRLNNKSLGDFEFRIRDVEVAQHTRRATPTTPATPRSSLRSSLRSNTSARSRSGSNVSSVSRTDDEAPVPTVSSGEDMGRVKWDGDERDEDDPLDYWLALRRGAPSARLRVRLHYSEFRDYGVVAAVRVDIIEASELPATDSLRGRSAFATASVGRDLYTTQTVTSALHPKWEENVDFFIGGASSPVLVITVVDSQKKRPLGDLNIPLDEDHLGDFWRPLVNAASGKIHIRITPLYVEASQDVLARRASNNNNKPVKSNDSEIKPRSSFMKRTSFLGSSPEELYPDGLNRITSSNDDRKNIEYEKTMASFPYAVLWQPHETAQACNQCHVDFSLWRRKHHCRVCLRVYCHRDSPYRAKIPRIGNKKKMRICGSCFTSLSSPQPKINGEVRTPPAQKGIFNRTRRSDPFSAVTDSVLLPRRHSHSSHEIISPGSMSESADEPVGVSSPRITPPLSRRVLSIDTTSTPPPSPQPPSSRTPPLTSPPSSPVVASLRRSFNPIYSSSSINNNQGNNFADFFGGHLRMPSPQEVSPSVSSPRSRHCGVHFDEDSSKNR